MCGGRDYGGAASREYRVKQVLAPGEGIGRTVTSDHTRSGCVTVSDPDDGRHGEIRSDRLAPREIVPHGMLEPGRLQELTSRIATGHYNRPDVLDRVVSRLLGGRRPGAAA